MSVSPLGSNYEDELVFEGIDGTECEDFVHKFKRKLVTDAALSSASSSKSPAEFDHLSAQLASACFVRGALRWYVELEPEVQESWKLLQKALMKDFPPPETREVRYTREKLQTFSLIPGAVPAAAPSRMRSSLTDAGCIKVICDSDPAVGGYISRTHSGDGVLLCTERKDAMRVSYTPNSSAPVKIAINDSNMEERYQWLGIYAFSFIEESTKTHDYGFVSAMTVTDGVLKRSGAKIKDRSIRTSSWKVSDDFPHDVTAVWQSSQVYELGFTVDKKRSLLHFVTDADGFYKRYSSERYISARLQFVTL